MQKLLRTSFYVVCSLGLSTAAIAQDEGGEDTYSDSYSSSSYSSSSSSSASSEKEGRGFGFGGQASLLGALAGPSIMYDFGSGHVDGLLGFGEVANTSRTQLQARYWHHMHEAEGADFSVGGGLGLDMIENLDTDVVLEAGAKVRVWVQDNVALGLVSGLSITTETDITALGNDLFGGASFHYFFN